MISMPRSLSMLVKASDLSSPPESDFHLITFALYCVSTYENHCRVDCSALSLVRRQISHVYDE